MSRWWRRLFLVFIVSEIHPAHCRCAFNFVHPPYFSRFSICTKPRLSFFVYKFTLLRTSKNRLLGSDWGIFHFSIVADGVCLFLRHRSFLRSTNRRWGHNGNDEWWLNNFEWFGQISMNEIFQAHPRSEYNFLTFNTVIAPGNNKLIYNFKYYEQ